MNTMNTSSVVHCSEPWGIHRAAFIPDVKCTHCAYWDQLQVIQDWYRWLYEFVLAVILSCSKSLDYSQSPPIYSNYLNNICTYPYIHTDRRTALVHWGRVHGRHGDFYGLKFHRCHHSALESSSRGFSIICSYNLFWFLARSSRYENGSMSTPDHQTETLVELSPPKYWHIDVICVWFLESNKSLISVVSAMRPLVRDICFNETLHLDWYVRGIQWSVLRNIFSDYVVA